MESVESTQEEVKFNSPVPEPHTIPDSSLSPPFLEQISNPDADRILVSENYGIKSKDGGATESIQWDEGGKYPYSALGGIKDPLNPKVFHLWCFSQIYIIIPFDV